jgi:translocator protein
MNADRIRQALVVASFAFAIVVNAAASILPLNGISTGEIADQWRVYVQPAGYVFSIWSVIYIGQLGFVLHTLRPSQREDPLLRRIGLWPVVIALLNGVWIFFWHWEIYPLTLVIMVALLVSLIVLYRRAGFDWTARPGGLPLRSAERWLVQVPFSIYLGWITVATIANVAIVGQWAGVPTFGIAPELIAAAVLAVGLGIAATVMLRNADVAYGAVIVWAYIGIVVKEMEVLPVASVAGAATLVVIVLIGASLVGRLPLRGRISAGGRPAS